MLAQGSRPIYASGECEVDLDRRELRLLGAPVPIGGRAFEIVELLVRSAGDLVTKDELMAHVWPGAVVLDNTLQVHIASVRRALGSHRALLKTESGRGYRLLGEWTLRGQAPEPFLDVPPITEPGQAATNFPSFITPLIGRLTATELLRNLVSAYRIVTLTGPGGIGKTTLALHVARDVFPDFVDGGWLVELASLSDPDLVPSAVASALQLNLSGGEISATAIALAIGDRNLLVILDNCEHVIDATASLAETLVRACPRVTILATSREVLRIDGEYVYRVSPLDLPAQDELANVMDHSAIELFIDRVQSRDSDFSPNADRLPLIAAICRHLDGIPLAIELAAARATTLGVELIAGGLRDRFTLLTGGRRTALPRHQTLRATLDWSYELLPEAEQRLLCRLAMFPAGFTLDAAVAIMEGVTADPSAVMDGVANLIDKSLVTPERSESAGRWQLLETTRAYALEKLVEMGGAWQVARCHAAYCLTILEQAEAEWETRPTAEWLADYGWQIHNLRAALDWAFSPNGEASDGIALVAAAVPLWTYLSLMDECRSRVEQALAALNAKARSDTRREMKLYAALATSLIYTGDSLPEQEAAWANTYELAEQLDDTEYRLRAAWDLWALNRVGKWNRAALVQAQKISSLSGNQTAPNHRLVGERMLGISYHYLGDQARARRHLENVLDEYVESGARAHIVRFQVDLRVSARTFLAPVLWLLGFPDQAARAAEAAIEDARAANHAMSLCHALAFGACPTALLVGDVPSGERYAHLLMDHATRHGFTRWHAYSQAFRGVLVIKRGDAGAGLQLLREGSKELGGFTTLRFMDFLMPEALCQAEEIAEGLVTVDEAIARSRETEEHRLTPELLRVKGELALREDGGEAAATAADLFHRAADLAHRQGALSLELRAAISLARLLRDQGRSVDALALLRPVYDRFTEGFDTADLKEAKLLLDAW
jgi:predicted ATPase/DNA-binding winged helix-turn-helix (wHTH) protein